MKTFFLRFFTWWNGQTFGTQVWTWLYGEAEASSIPPSWHGWIHHTVDVPPTEERYQPRPWQKPHRPNLTGTPGAHRPTGSTLAQGRRPKATGDYKAWNPGR